MSLNKQTNINNQNGFTSKSESQDEDPELKASRARQMKAMTRQDMSFNMLRILHLADFITLMNGCCGLFSIFCCLKYCIEGSEDSSLLIKAILLSYGGLIFDFLDGKVARWRRKSSLMGQELDSLADLVSFGVAPATCAFTIGFRTSLDILILAFFFSCGLARLARFNVTVAYIPKDQSGKSKYFEGTPIPTTLSIDALMAYWIYNGWINSENLPLGLIGEGSILEFHPVVLLFFFSGCGMISKRLHIPKP